jgi:hypothetical protein
MKASLILSVCVAATLLPTGAALAQEATSRVPDSNPDSGAAVDASVHAAVDEQSARQPQPSRETNKRQQNPYSRWSFQPGNQAATTRFQPAQPVKPLAQPESGDTPMTLFNPLTRSDAPAADALKRGQNTPFGTSRRTGTAPLGSSAAPDPQSDAVRKLLQSINSNNAAPVPAGKTKSSSLSPYHRDGGPVTSYSPKKPGPTTQSSLPRPFSKSAAPKADASRTNSQKHKPEHSAGRDKPQSPLDPQTNPRK